MNSTINPHRCCHCGERIYFDSYFKEWTHRFTGDPQCTNSLGMLLNTEAWPAEETNVQ